MIPTDLVVSVACFSNLFIFSLTCSVLPGYKTHGAENYRFRWPPKCDGNSTMAVAHALDSYRNISFAQSKLCRQFCSFWCADWRCPGDGPGCAAEAGVERAVRAERVAVLHASARRAAAGRRRPARLPHGRRSSRRLHGPHPHLPGASREAQGAARRLRRVQLSQSHRALHHR